MGRQLTPAPPLPCSLKESSTVDQLLRYMLGQPDDTDDPKKQYK